MLLCQPTRALDVVFDGKNGRRLTLSQGLWRLAPQVRDAMAGLGSADGAREVLKRRFCGDTHAKCPTPAVLYVSSTSTFKIRQQRSD